MSKETMREALGEVNRFMAEQGIFGPVGNNGGDVVARNRERKHPRHPRKKEFVFDRRVQSQIRSGGSRRVICENLKKYDRDRLEHDAQLRGWKVIYKAGLDKRNVRWFIKPEHLNRASRGIQFLRDLLSLYELTRLDKVKINYGRGSKTTSWAWGMCYYRKKGSVVSVQVTGEFPWRASIVQYGNKRTQALRSRKNMGEKLKDWDEAVAFIGAHEAFHFLSHDKQIDRANNEYEADEFALEMLTLFREGKQSLKVDAHKSSLIL